MWQLKTQNFDKTQQLKMWQNTKTTIVTKIRIRQNAKLDNSKTKHFAKLKKLKMWQAEKINCDKTFRLKLRQSSET